jgi:hypothetical protein
LIALELHLEQTELFIDQNPAQLVFQRKQKEDDGAGGVRSVEDLFLAPQTARVVGQRAPLVRVTPDGRTVYVTKVIIGMPSLDVLAEDLVDHDGQTYEVLSVWRDPAWRTYAEVVSRA